MDTAWVEPEMSGALLGDRRQVRSVTRITAAVAAQTHLSLTAACGNGLRQAAHRVFEHPETSVAGLLAGHYAATAARCAAFPVVLVAQDTTTFSFKQAQLEGLGEVNQSGQTGALLGHAALALTECGTPLGLLHLELWGATDGSAPCPHARESGKWQAAQASVAAHAPALGRVILIQDREGDFFEFLAAERPAPVELLVRAAHDRRLKGAAPPAPPETRRLFAAAAQGTFLGEWRVLVPGSARQSHQILPRQREAVLELRGNEVTLQRPQHAPDTVAAEVRVWVLEAREMTPPAGEAPVHWILLTTLAVRSLAEASRVVGYYARRWVIERLHFTLKSGLRAERLQIDDARSLGHCLALYYVVAWRLLHLTYLARECPDRPAAETLTTDELAVLRTLTRQGLSTLREAVREIAILGGYQYYRTAPPPGVKSLWLGWQRLTGMVEGWRLAHSTAREL